MKFLRIFGLAALAVLTAMAFTGAGSAMASTTALCGDDPGAGACNTLFVHVHESSTSKVKVLSSAITVECDALFRGDVDSTGFLASPLVIHGFFTYTNCGSCGMYEDVPSAEFKVLKTSHETAKVTYELRLHVECGVFIDCIYSGAGLEGTAKGPLLSAHLNGDVTLSEQVLSKVEGFGCPSTAKLDIQTSPLEHTYIGS